MDQTETGATLEEDAPMAQQLDLRSGKSGTVYLTIFETHAGVPLPQTRAVLMVIPATDIVRITTFRNQRNGSRLADRVDVPIRALRKLLADAGAQQTPEGL